jgi:hypothetical protein
MDNREVIALFAPLFDDFNNLVTSAKKPLLAHYTSLEVLEKIMRNDELWLSNPLYMNDLQEMHFGMSRGFIVFQSYCREPSFLASCGSLDRVERLRLAFERHFAEFDIQQALDVYVFCLSEHDEAKPDGRLSMWRGYGGNGNGAALVFNSDFVILQPDSPLLFIKVVYASDNDRIASIRRHFESCMSVLETNTIPDDRLDLVAKQMFDLMKLYALTSKHVGFEEEHEWRVIYLPDRDPTGMLTKSYVVGKTGIEPKLKMTIAPLRVSPLATWTFDSILKQIILGPTQSSTLAIKSVWRMLELNGKASFMVKVSASGIPFRPSR